MHADGEANDDTLDGDLTGVACTPMAMPSSAPSAPLPSSVVEASAFRRRLLQLLRTA
jgi:hypothetical protein